jgi:hypothetical protein
MSESPPKTPRVGAYSRSIARGSLGDLDGRSREGRFLRHAERGLIAQIGGEPSFAQTLLVRRIARTMLQLDLLDEKFASGAWNDHDSRTQGGLANSLRLSLRELGLKSAPKPRSNPLLDHFARVK